jgi:hypothetical protein
MEIHGVERTSAVRWRALVIVVALAAAGCAVPSSVPKQAEDVASIAAEGALLAGDVADEDSTTPFATTHARALRRNAEELRKAIRQPELRSVADGVVAELTRLASSPSDRSVAARVERALDHAAQRADEIAKRAQ